MRNLRLLIAYDGTDFCGWQRQPGAATIQGILERHLGKIVGGPINLCGSGRTDSGVHASGQVASFKTLCSISCDGLTKALNALLPPSVRIRKSEEMHPSFHARYDACAKTYRYRILQAPLCPPYAWRFVYHYPRALNVKGMAASARLLEGEHNFASFAAADERPKPATYARRIFQSRILVRPRLSLLIYEVSGTGFLRHMVRNIVGTLIEVGSGRRSAEDMIRILDARDRKTVGPTAPARGLYLVDVQYEKPKS